MDLSLHTVDLFSDGKPWSHKQTYTITAEGSLSVHATIGASSSAILTYNFTLWDGSGYVTPLSSMLSGFSSTGAVTGPASFNGVFSTTKPATYTFESEVRQAGRTEVAKSGITIYVSPKPVATTLPPAHTDTYSFTFGNFTTDMISGKKFHTSYDGKAAPVDKALAQRQVVSFLADGHYVRVMYDYPPVDSQDNSKVLSYAYPTTQAGLASGNEVFAAHGTWAFATESTFGVIRMTETARFPFSSEGVSSTATTVTSHYRVALDPAATASNLQLKFIRTTVYNSATDTFGLDPLNPFKDEIASPFGSAGIFTPSSICGGSTSLPTLPATTTLLTLAGQEASTTGCTTVP